MPNLNTDPLIPVTTDGQPVSWDGNWARALGLLHETWQHFERHSIHIPFVTMRAALLPSGGSLAPYVAITAMPDGASDSVIVQPLKVKEDGGKVMTSLFHVFGHAEPSQELFNNAAGDPYALVSELIRRCNNASVADKAVVTAEFEQIKTAGPVGQLTLEKVTAFSLKYTRARASLAPAVRPPPAAEVNMVELYAFRDPSVRGDYRQASGPGGTPPTTFAEAIALLKSILTATLRAEQLGPP